MTFGAKIVKSEQSLKNIQKSSKRNFTNNFVGNLDIYCKIHNQTQRILSRLTLERLGDGRELNLIPPCGFSENVSSRESVKL